MVKSTKKSENKQNQTNPFSDMEKEVLNFWEKNKIFEKSVDKKAPKGDYVFYDGPPFATGTPHYGHIVASIMKDVVPRYWTMQGYKVERRWGWDCHGLPIENIVEKEMGSKSKKDIEKLGVEKFNNLCRSKVLGYVDEWEAVIRRLGRWADMENAYKTMDLEYMESIWYVFKELHNNGLVYEGYRSMHICPRCETTLSQQEVAEGYKNIKDLSATVKFKIKQGQEIKDPPGQEKDSVYKIPDNTYFLAWTTTPWTLIGNVALAVGYGFSYTLFSKDGVNYITSDKFAKAEKKKNKETVKLLRQFTTHDLINLEYESLFDYYITNDGVAPINAQPIKHGWKIYGADFVTNEEGTGVVHIAPAFGEDDLNLAKEYNLPVVQHVGMDGVIEKKAKDFKGKSISSRAKNKPEEIREIDLEIVRFLDDKIFDKAKYEHSYPHCWRCETSLINYLTSSWFVSITNIKDKLLKTAKEINWSPNHMKEGRFGKWLEGARDWSISRQRFWASVIPVWRCTNEVDGKRQTKQKCGNTEVFGSVKELNVKSVMEQ
jgi:isoleucyl-tRNA synthetase